MAAVLNSQKIGHGDNLEPGATHTFGWNNPPMGKVISYMAFPVVGAPGDGKFNTTSGAISVSKVVFQIVDSNYDGFSQVALIDITNGAANPCGWDLYENWID